MQNLDDYPQVSHKTLQTDLQKFTNFSVNNYAPS